MRKLFVVLGIVIFCCGCSTLNRIILGTPEERQARAKAQEEAANPLRQYNVSYDLVFRSTLRALVDLGFTVHSSDATSGIISASLHTQEQGYSPNPTVRHFTGMDQEMTVLVDKINDQQTEVKITPGKWEYFEENNGQRTCRPLNWWEGVSYKSIFDRLQVELDRRQGSGQ